MDSRLFGASYRIMTETVGHLYPSALRVDLSVQRDLSKARTKHISNYVLNAIRRDSVGAFFAPLVASERDDGNRYLIDGQHRWYGIVRAVEDMKIEIDSAVTALARKNLDARMREELNASLTHQRIILKDLESSQVPIMVYCGLTQKEEQQLFHDLNNLARKAPLSLSLQYNSSDAFVSLAKEVVTIVPGLEELVEHSRGSNKVGRDKLFLFSTIYKTVFRLIGKSAFSGDVSMDDLYRKNLELAVQFLRIVVESLPADKYNDTYLYRDAKVLQGIAEFARQMREVPRVDWAVTLRELLTSFRFDHRNHLFVTIGQASKNNQGSIVFRGTGSGISAVARTLASQARRLDSRGEEVDEAYGSTLSKVDDDEPGTLGLEFADASELFPPLTSSPNHIDGVVRGELSAQKLNARIIRDEDIRRVLHSLG